MTLGVGGEVCASDVDIGNKQIQDCLWVWGNPEMCRQVELSTSEENFRSMTNKSNQAYRRIKQAIEEGQVPPGERLTEARAAELVGMSRGPVRESLVRLEAEGLLQNCGSRRSRVVAYVEDQNPEEMLARYELREQIESGAAWLAAKNMTGWQIDYLRELTEELESGVRENDPKRYSELVGSYRQFVLEKCGNSLMMDIWRTYNLSPPQPRSEKVKAEIFGLIPDGEKEEPSFREITDAIASHNSDLAEQLMKKRVRKITEAIRKYVWKLQREEERS